MIYKLQRKFILVCTVSVLTVVVLVFGVILLLNINSMNKNLDLLVERVYEGGGKFPGAFEEKPRPDTPPPKNEPSLDFITPETPFSTRHFTVIFDSNGMASKTFTESIYSITDEEAIDYAKSVIDNGDERGWLYSYRYKVFSEKGGTGVVFVDGSMSRSSLTQSITIAGFVLLGCAALVLLLIILLSKRVVKPIAESYEKQKQFITDANHELKTPLTIMLANIDIAESELGENEWLDDMRSTGHRMTELVNQLVALSRMDEDGYKMNFSNVAIGALVAQTVSEFEPLAKERGKQLIAHIDETASILGDEALLSRLVGILLDNAIKYCDDGGEINVSLYQSRRIVLSIENTYTDVNKIELERLFDRFYRADKARKFTGGYGIGLSMAKVITEKHKGEITSFKKDDSHIGFKVVL